MKRIVVAGIAVLVVLLVAVQAVPYGRNHTNPPVRAEPAWDSPRTRELAVRACYACHSNETTWPWYSNLAPVSWLVQYDVDQGRAELNFSEWGAGEQEGGEAAETVVEGSMPPWFYVILNPEGRLSAAERQALITGLQATLGTDGEGDDD
ncbi:MAG TPA: heme-binding domain-containing protein [Dehalococcoidia bacterium]|nr:heme-binding domain-containing protein [Dehalococcoidia bacterium]